MEKTIITLSGQDTVGIIAKVCTFFADNQINILDIAQTTDEGRIDMMMVVDTRGFKGSFKDLVEGLDEVGKAVNCTIKAQHEEIFDMMHRI